ncbi:MFS general substrate transporter [Viridothelium virens]|uniref:MFS general substrate transporter n=1 Tax=Viridothelium virens TaxID=1048519 RepID=A0A6A6GYI2_VIRVR|nr:MFS general substrate transporter [Viridothelium virens]
MAFPNRRSLDHIPVELQDQRLPGAISGQSPDYEETLEASQSPSVTQNERRAILIVVASFALTFTGCGLNFAFGVYQELYESMGGPFENVSPAAIDLIGTLAVSIMTIGAPVASSWTKAYSPRSVVLIGGLLLGLGNILASFGNQLWHFILTQGLLVGMGTSLSYIPAVTVSPGWFDKRRGLAMGVVSSGTGVGGVCWAPALRALNAKIGFRNTLRLTGVVGFVMIGVAGLVLKWDPDSERRNEIEYPRNSGGFRKVRIPLVDWRIARSRTFVAQAVGATLQSAAYYTPVYFFSAYSRTLGYTAAAGANFIAASNASSAGGKVALGWFADRFGRLNTLLACTLISAAITLGLWLPSTLTGVTESHGKGLFVAFAITYGIFAGSYISLFPTALVEIFGVQNFASVNGFLYMVRGFGTLAGTPAAGALIKSRSHMSISTLQAASAYERTAILIGALLAAATLAVLWVRMEAAGTKLKA